MASLVAGPHDADGSEECVSQLDGQTLVTGSRLITLLDSTATTVSLSHFLFGALCGDPGVSSIINHSRSFEQAREELLRGPRWREGQARCGTGKPWR